MAIDPHPTADLNRTDPGFRLNDDLPTYRAVSPLAVVAFVLGLLSILSFTSLYFLAFGAGSLIVGLLAERSIRRYSDILTGSNMVRAGFVLSLAFCLGSSTIAIVNDVIIRLEASRFGREVAEALSTKGVNEFLYLKAVPQSRKGKSAEKVAEEMQHGAQAPQQWEMETEPIRALKERVKASGKPVAYEGLAWHVSDGMNALAAVSLSVPDDKGGTAEALVRVKGIYDAGKYAWFIEELKYPAR